MFNYTIEFIYVEGKWFFLNQLIYTNNVSKTIQN